MAILFTTLCERTDDHGGRRCPTSALWPHSRRHTALRNHNKKQVNVVKSRKNIVIYTIMTINRNTAIWVRAGTKNSHPVGFYSRNSTKSTVNPNTTIPQI